MSQTTRIQTRLLGSNKSLLQKRIPHPLFSLFSFLKKHIPNNIAEFMTVKRGLAWKYVPKGWQGKFPIPHGSTERCLLWPSVKQGDKGGDTSLWYSNAPVATSQKPRLIPVLATAWTSLLGFPLWWLRTAGRKIQDSGNLWLPDKIYNTASQLVALFALRLLSLDVISLSKSHRLFSVQLIAKHLAVIYWFS